MPLSGYLRIVSEVGIIGLLLFLVACLSPIRRNFKYSQYIPDSSLKSLVRGLSYFAIFAVVAYLARTILIDIAFIALGWAYFLNREIMRNFRLSHTREF